MPGGADDQRTRPFPLVPVVVMAAGVVALALAVSGVLWKSTTGTIVVERITFNASTTARPRSGALVRTQFTSITETSASGNLQRSFTAVSTTRRGFQDVEAGDAIQLYDPDDNTIYMTTDRALQRATTASIRATAPKGTHVSVGSMHAVGYSTPESVPGRTSVFLQELRAGAYRLGGHATVDGRAAIRLVQTHTTRLPIGANVGGFQSAATVYVSPGSYDPIEEVVRVALPGQRTRTVERWLTYRMLSATAANQRLVSLTARHPGARVVRNAMAYLRASQSETRTTVTSSG